MVRRRFQSIASRALGRHFLFIGSRHFEAEEVACLQHAFLLELPHDFHAAFNGSETMQADR